MTTTGTVLKICPCGKEFEPKKITQIHCSFRCPNHLNHNWYGSDAQRNAKYKTLYGISLEEYNTLFQEQNGCCKICGKHQKDLKHKLSVDHCHKTNKVRGLLCGKCNQALGLINENPDILKRMEEYIK